MQFPSCRGLRALTDFEATARYRPCTAAVGAEAQAEEHLLAAHDDYAHAKRRGREARAFAANSLLRVAAQPFDTSTDSRRGPGGVPHELLLRRELTFVGIEQAT
jgi:hypothetical protein